MPNTLTRKISQLNRDPLAAPDLAGGLLEMSLPKGPVAGGYVSFAISYEQFTAGQIKGGSYTALTLATAKALPAADPPGVVPNQLYGVTGRWNATTTDSTVYVHGVKPMAFHRLGVIYDAQGVGQLVEVNVVAGTYTVLNANDPRFGTTTAADPAAPLSALIGRKPFFGFAGSNPPTGFDTLEDALNNSVNTLSNTGEATIENASLTFGHSFFGNGMLVRIADAVQIDNGDGTFSTSPGSFFTEATSQIHSAKLIPVDYYDTAPVKPKGVIKTFRNFPSTYKGLPEPTDCTEFHAGSLIGYPLGLSGTAGGYVLNNSTATAGTGSGNIVVYLYGNSSISGTLGSGTTVVQPPGVAMPYVGTATKKQWVVKNRTYSSGGLEYKWIGANTQLNAFDATNPGWLPTGGGSGTGGTGMTRDPYDVPTPKALQVIADYASAGGPFVETDDTYYDCVIIDDYTQPGDEFKYECSPSRPVNTGGATVWKWRKYREAGV
jgi:hypothetical protein